MLFILGFVIAIIGILGLVCGVKKNKFSLVFLFSCFCGVGLFMFMIYASPVSDYKYQAFVLQKGYIESHVSKSEIEDAALTAKKVELNQWLFENQSNIGNHPEFYCGIPDGFMEQTPIQ